MRKLILAATGLAALAVPAVAPVMASAAASADKTVTVTTHTTQHADTTDHAGTGTQDSPNGPVWAYDNMALKYVVTPQGVPTAGVNQYDVRIDAEGSFDAFANPRDGSAYTGTGSVKGWIDYLVTSPDAPNKANVPAQEPNGSGIRAAITQLLGKDATIVGGGAYSFTYNPVAGRPYTQSG